MTEEQRLAKSLLESLDQAAILEFDRIARLTTQVLGVPVGLVSLVEERRQVFAGTVGMSPPYSDFLQSPLNQSFCELVLSSHALVVVGDASQDERFGEQFASQSSDVIAYLGFPIADSDGTLLGVFCLIDSEPRVWTEEEIDIARDFAAIAATQAQCMLQGNYQRDLLDVLTHDLKNPLTAINFSSQLLLERRDTLPSQVGELLDAVTDSAAQAFELLAQVGKHKESSCEGELCQLAVAVEKMTESMRPSATAKGITIRSNPLPEKVYLATDEWLVERVLDNLLSNAIKYTPREGQVAIDLISVGATAGVRITDSGPGFSEEDIALLYQRYLRLSALPTEGESSSGLGLSIAKRLATQAGGSLELVSGPSESASFEVLFPIREPVALD